MRFGLVADVVDTGDPLSDLVLQATAAEANGLDLVWLPESDTLPSPAVAAAALAPHLTSLHVGIEVRAGGHPVHLAEQAVVTDLCLAGRLVLAVTSTDAGLLGETVDVLLAATAARPFRHEGSRWRIPANLPANEVNRQDRVRVTPATAQLELPVWVCGPHAAPVARDRCLTHVGSSGDTTADLTRAWEQTQARLALATARLRRVAVRALATDDAGLIDDEALVDRLRADQHGWGMDVALLRLPTGTAVTARLRTLEQLAERVLPRLQLDRLPPGLEQYWRQRQGSTT